MKSKLFFSITPVALLMPFIFMWSQVQNPERDFIGSWKEIAWEYKEADRFLISNLGDIQNRIANTSDSVRFHTAETWDFQANGILLLHSDNATTKTVNWRLKGRGNILEITDGMVTEHYDISNISGNKIELNYISDTHVKESARLVFEKQ